ncbi:MAG: hypothetical protein IT452_07745 [Planctomycetia bacterium]|nr:hypothetical protein [Planctomycetia bacterium]
MNEDELLQHPISQHLESRCRPQLDALAEVLKKRHPDLQVHVYGHTVGSQTSFQAFELGIECGFPRDVLGTSDNIALSITVSHLDAMPRINAGISWGHSDCPADPGVEHPDWRSLTPPFFDET